MGKLPKNIRASWPSPALRHQRNIFQMSIVLMPDHLNQTCVPQIDDIYKVHKKIKKQRPVISSVNSIPELFSKHVDYWLKKVVGNLLLTYIKDAEHIMQSLHETFPNGLPPGAKLFLVNAVGMYSNINTNHGIDVMT